MKDAKTSNYLIIPGLKIAWDSLVVLFSTYFAILVPLNAVFHFQLNSFIVSMSLLGSAVFLADILVTLRRIDQNKDGLLIGVPKSRREYFQSTFIFDLMAVVPIGLFTPNLVWEIFRLVKMIKVGKTMYVWRHYSVRSSNYLMFFFSAYWILLITHWLACGWIALQTSSEISAFSTYIKSLYWTVSTITSVGYGDIIPEGNVQMIYCIFIMFVGLGFYGYIIGNIAGFLFEKDPAHENFVRNLDRLSAMTRYHDLPEGLQKKILTFFTYSWSKKRGYYESDFLESLPTSLKTEVSLHLKQDIIEKVPLFQNASRKFQEEISFQLHPLLVAPNDYVIHAGDPGKEMYFVIRGKLEVIAPDGTTILATLRDGDFFGEIALIKNVPRNASVKAVSYCDLYFFSRKSFEEVRDKFPDIAAALGEKIVEREQHLYPEYRPVS